MASYLTENMRWLEEHRETHGGQWVALRRGKLVALAGTLGTLRVKLEQEAPDSERPFVTQVDLPASVHRCALDMERLAALSREVAAAAAQAAALAAQCNRVAAPAAPRAESERKITSNDLERALAEWPAYDEVRCFAADAWTTSCVEVRAGIMRARRQTESYSRPATGPLLAMLVGAPIGDASSGSGSGPVNRRIFPLELDPRTREWRVYDGGLLDYMKQLLLPREEETTDQGPLLCRACGKSYALSLFAIVDGYLVCPACHAKREIL